MTPKMYKSDKRANVDTTLTTMQSCIGEVGEWALCNRLKLNDDKTELLLSDSQKSSASPSSLTIGQTDVPFSSTARNLGVQFDDMLTMSAQVNKVCQNAYLEIRKIASIRKYLTTEATKTLVVSLVLSRLDFCNSLLAGLPHNQIEKLQRVMNSAARLIFRVSKHEHISPLLYRLHWLPISLRIQFKISTICFNIVSGSAPPYLSELLQIYTPSRSLRSSSDCRKFCVPRRRRKFQGQRAFSYIGPVVWNDLPFSIRHAETLSSFKSLLKTHLFKKHFS